MLATLTTLHLLFAMPLPVDDHGGITDLSAVQDERGLRQPIGNLTYRTGVLAGPAQ